MTQPVIISPNTSHKTRRLIQSLTDTGQAVVHTDGTVRDIQRNRTRLHNAALRAGLRVSTHLASATLTATVIGRR